MAFSVSGEPLNSKYATTDVFEDYIGNTLWTWGYNLTGQLGTNDTLNYSSPTQILSSINNWKTVSVASSHSAGIKTDGTLWLWGLGTSGQLGGSNRISFSSPVQTVSASNNWSQVVCGTDNFTCAIKTDGTLWVWGVGTGGQLGTDNRLSYSSPVQTIAGGTNWKKISCGYQGVSAIKTDGTLWLWGRGINGQLGDNTLLGKSSPVQTVSGGTNWKEVSRGYYHTLAIKTDGTLWTWGGNDYGQLGDNTIVGKSSPIQTIAGGINWKQCAGGTSSSSAIKTDGTLWLWGYNSYGNLGTNNTTNYSSPVQTVAGGTNWKLVTGGYYCTAAIKTDGTLWMWGRNQPYGQLGDNTVTDRSSPVQTITGGTNWKFVSSGYEHSAAITFSDYQ